MPKGLQKDLKTLYDAIRKGRLLFVVSVFLDFIFISVLFYAFYKIINEIFTIIMQMSEVFRRMPVAETLEEQAAALEMVAGVDFFTLYGSLIKWVFIAAIVSFAMWLVFQGVNFFIAARIVDRKTGFLPYVGKFAAFSVFFYGVCAFAFWLTVIASRMIGRTVFSFLAPLFAMIVIAGILVAALYFWLISLVFARTRKMKDAFFHTFRLGVKKFGKIFLIYFLLLLVLDAFILLAYFSYFIHIYLFMIFVLFIIVPMLTVLRISLFYFVERVK